MGKCRVHESQASEWKAELMKDPVRRNAIIKLFVVFALIIGVLVLFALVLLGKLG